MSRLTIREAVASDLTTILDMRDEATTWLATKGTTQWQPGEPQMTGVAGVQDAIELGTCYLAEVDGTPAGTITVDANPDADFWTSDEQAELALYASRMIVAREFAGRNYGRELLDFAEELARAQHCQWLRLSAWKDNHQLHAYYVRQGFQHVRTVNLVHRGAGALFQRRITATQHHRAVAYRSADLFGAPRFAGYLNHCNGDSAAALDLYQWNATASAAFWETLGHLEIALRNALMDAAGAWHQHRGRTGSWLDDPAGELSWQARQDIAKARDHVRRKGYPPSDGQTVAELGFGFWRFLLARRYNTTLWPGLARAFPHAPQRRRQLVELPLVQLHELRNRLAHHERIWNQPLSARYGDILTVLGYIDPDLERWVATNCRVPALLAACPQPRPHP